MATILKQSWWILLIRGIAALIFALFLLFAPSLTLASGALSFAILFGIYALVDGFSTIYSAVVHRVGQWFWWVLFGIISVIAGFIALGNPFLFGTFTLVFMIYILAFKSITGGIIQMIAAWQLRQEIDNEWLLAIDGFFALVFGLIILSRPLAGLEILILLTAFYLIMAGVMQIILGFKVRGWVNNLGRA